MSLRDDLDKLRSIGGWKDGRSPTFEEQMADRHGSWEAYQEAAGIEPDSRGRMTDAELIAALRRRPYDRAAREAAQRLEELTARSRPTRPA